MSPAQWARLIPIIYGESLLLAQAVSPSADTMERLGTVGFVVVVMAFMLRYFMRGFEKQLEISRQDAERYQQQIERITERFAQNIDANTKATQEGTAATKALREEIIRAGKHPPMT